MTTYKEIEAYYKDLEEAYNSKQESNRFNKDRSHNATIFRFMLDKSKEIYMFCGELSILRCGFKEHVVKDCGESDGEKIMKAMYDSFTRFLSDDGKKIHIILEKSASSDFVSDLVPKDFFMKALKRRQIELRALGDNLTSKEGLDHFTFTDTQIVRIEQNKIEHSAICTMNGVQYFNKIKTTFDNLNRFAVPVNCYND